MGETTPTLSNTVRASVVTCASVQCEAPTLSVLKIELKERVGTIVQVEMPLFNLAKFTEKMKIIPVQAIPRILI